MDLPHSRKYLFSRDDRNEEDKRHWVLAPKSTISCEQAIKNLVDMNAPKSEHAREDEHQQTNPSDTTSFFPMPKTADAPDQASTTGSNAMALAMAKLMLRP